MAAESPESGVVVSFARVTILVLIGLNAVLVVGRVLLYRPLLDQAGALAYILEPLVLLAVYACLAFCITADRSPYRRQALCYGSIVGVASGLMWIVNLALETFADLSRLGLVATAPFLLGGFLLWGLAGGLIAWRTGSVSTGILASLWSAMVCVLITIGFGLILTYTALPRLESILVSDPDFLRSHWQDLRAFAIANSFDSAFSHLLGSLVIGVVSGAVGSALGLMVTTRDRLGDKASRRSR